MSAPETPIGGNALVVGAGAIGTVLAAHMHARGVAVEVFTKPADAADYAMRHGLRTEGVGGSFVARPRVVWRAEELTSEPDIVFLATKSVHVAVALGELTRHIGRKSTIVVMQNGYCDEEVARIVGPSRVIGCTVKFGATLLGHGHARRTTHGGFVIGPHAAPINGSRATTDRVQALLNCCAPTSVSDNMIGVKYAKMVFNSCASTLGAVSGLNLRDIVTSRYGREAFLRAATEAIDVFRHMGIRLEPIAGVSMTLLHLGPSGQFGGFSRSRLVAEAIIRLIGWMRGDILSSMLQSIRRGEQTEIDCLNGHIVQKARQHGLAVPVNERLIRLVGEISAGQRRVCRQNLVIACRGYH